MATMQGRPPLADTEPTDSVVLRVLVFGTTGIGKTSLCNALTGRSRQTGNGARGVTAKSHICAPFSAKGKKIQLVDTVGLHESSSGTVPAEEAFGHVVEILTNAKDGFNLLVHVSRAGRLTKEHQEDFEFFVEKLTLRKIPVVLVLTACENVTPMNSWVDDNKSQFDAFGYAELIGTCFATGGPLETHYAPLRRQSKAEVIRSILAHALPAPHLLYGDGTNATFGQTLLRVWNFVVDLSGLPKQWRGHVNESAYELIKRLGLPERVAKLAIAHLPDLAHELANKLPIPGSGHVGRGLMEMLLKVVLPKPR